MTVISVRVGYVPASNRPDSPRAFSVWCSHRDVAQMFRLCLGAPRERSYDTVFATSRNKWGYRDLSHAKTVLGFEPQDAAEDYR